MPTAVRDVRSQGQSGKHILAVSFSGFDPRTDLGSTVVAPTSFPEPFINIKFHAALSQSAVAGNYWPDCRLKFQEKWEASDMKKAVLALATAATIGVTALVASSPAHAWRGGWGPGLAGGLVAGAVIGGIASSAYAYGPGYGYYGGPGYGYAPAYYGGYAPAYYDYGYAPPYYGGYGSNYYAPAYYGPRYRRVVRPAYAYYGPRYYRGHRYRW
jgi:hypothetical protein